jgi:hypothetical protein
MFGWQDDVLLGAPQTRKQFWRFWVPSHFVREEWDHGWVSQARLQSGYGPQGSSCRNSMNQALAKASKAAESSQEIPPPTESISESPEVMELHLDWCTPFMIFLRTGGLPEDKDEHEWLHHQTGHYTLVNDELFRRGANDTLMWCILQDEGCIIL